MASGPQARPLVVIGAGNDMRGDDAAGLLVAGILARLAPSGILVRRSGGDGAQILEWLSEASSAVIVDACVSGARPGTIRRFDAADGPIPAIFASASTHAFGVTEAIELARALGQLPTRVRIIGIEVGSVELGSAVSAEVLAAIELVAAELAAGRT